MLFLRKTKVLEVQKMNLSEQTQHVELNVQIPVWKLCVCVSSHSRPGGGAVGTNQLDRHKKEKKDKRHEEEDRSARAYQDFR